MLINIDVIKRFVDKLKHPFSYLYEDEFKQLDLLIKFYEDYLKKD